MTLEEKHITEVPNCADPDCEVHHPEVREFPTRVEDIPFPWAHTMGTVIAIEYPEDRPNVVDLVFQSNQLFPNGYRSAETKSSLYRYYPIFKVWDYPNPTKDRD